MKNMKLAIAALIISALAFISGAAESQTYSGGGSGGSDTYGNLPPATGISTFLTTPSGANLTSALTSPLTAGGGGTGATSLGTSLAVSSGVLNTTQTINAQGSAASYTVLSTDMGKTVTHSKSTAVAETLPQAGTTGFLSGVSYSEINLGAGVETITPTTSTINGASTLTLSQNQSAYITSDGTNWVAFLGAASGGSGTVNSGTSGQMAAYASTGSSVSGVSGITYSGATLTAGALVTSAANAWNTSQSVAPVTDSISTATFTPNFAASNNHNITLVHASCPCTLANPTNIVAGQSGVIVLNQSSSGSDTIGTYGTDYVFTNAAAPTLSTAASAVDELSYYVVDSTHIRVAPLTSTAVAGTTATPTVGTNVTSCTCATAACTNLRGTYTIVGGTATTGTICSLAWTATPTAYVCTATMNGGASAFGIGNSVATTTGVNITAGVSVAASTFSVNYSCQP